MSTFIDVLKEQYEDGQMSRSAYLLLERAYNDAAGAWSCRGLRWKAAAKWWRRRGRRNAIVFRRKEARHADRG